VHHIIVLVHVDCPVGQAMYVVRTNTVTSELKDGCQSYRTGRLKIYFWAIKFNLEMQVKEVLGNS